MEEKEVTIRPLVLKLEKKFREYVAKFGPVCVEACLRNGRYGKTKLTVMCNKKDRFQMLQVLGMERDRSEAPKGLPYTAADGQQFQTSKELATYEQARSRPEVQ